MVPARLFNLRDFGAVADGHTPVTDAFRRAFASIAQAGGGTLIVPAGDYFTGPIELCSNLNLRLERGARLHFSQEVADYRMAQSKEELNAKSEIRDAQGKPPAKFRPMVGAQNAHDIIISGAGTFDGQGQPWWVLERKAKNEARAKGLPDAEIGRPLMINFGSLSAGPVGGGNPDQPAEIPFCSVPLRGRHGRGHHDSIAGQFT